jgi:hypothetical protein
MSRILAIPASPRECLQQDFLGGKEIEGKPACCPPVLRGFLLGGNLQIPACPAGEQAWNGRLYVNRGFHWVPSG